MKKTDKIIGRLIGVSWRAIRKQFAHNISLSDFDVSAEQGMILAILSHYDRVNQQTLAEFLHCEKTAIMRWVDYLESKDLVKRVPNKEDRRQNLLELTSEGKTLAEEFIKIGLMTEKQALRSVDKEHAKICKEVLLQVIANLGEK